MKERVFMQVRASVVALAGLAVVLSCWTISRLEPLAEAAQQNESSAGRIPLAEFKKLYDEGNAIVLDVRGIETYREGHIPGAISVPLGTVEARAAEWKTTKRPIVTYCS
jgi:3-mercaptopyruvate sulfurtransferase SseA